MICSIVAKTFDCSEWRCVKLIRGTLLLTSLFSSYVSTAINMALLVFAAGCLGLWRFRSHALSFPGTKRPHSERSFPGTKVWTFRSREWNDHTQLSIYGRRGNGWQSTVAASCLLHGDFEQRPWPVLSHWASTFAYSTMRAWSESNGSIYRLLVFCKPCDFNI